MFSISEKQNQTQHHTRFCDRPATLVDVLLLATPAPPTPGTRRSLPAESDRPLAQPEGLWDLQEHRGGGPEAFSRWLTPRPTEPTEHLGERRGGQNAVEGKLVGYRPRVRERERGAAPAESGESLDWRRFGPASLRLTPALQAPRSPGWVPCKADRAARAPEGAACPRSRRRAGGRWACSRVPGRWRRRRRRPRARARGATRRLTASSGAAACPAAPRGRARRPPSPRRAATPCTCGPGPRPPPGPPPRIPRRRTCAAR